LEETPQAIIGDSLLALDVLLQIQNRVSIPNPEATQQQHWFSSLVAAVCVERYAASMACQAKTTLEESRQMVEKNYES